VSDHLERLALIEYIEDADDIDRNAIAAHLATCLECRTVLQELEDLYSLLSDAAIFRFAADDAIETGWAEGRTSLEALIGSAVEEEHMVAAIFGRLQVEPVESWTALLAEHSNHQSAALVQRIIQAAEPDLDRNPQRALAILIAAETAALALPDAESRRQLGHVWRQRSNALRMLAQYEQAISAAVVAQNFYDSLPDPDASFESGRAHYTSAIALFKMTRYGEALQALERSQTMLSEYGTSAPLAKTMMLDALIRIERGDVVKARETLRKLLPIEEQLGQRIEEARVRANLAECGLRLGHLDEAMADARAALAAFQKLGNTAEETRSAWTVAMIQLALGEPAALRQLHEVADVFQRLDMPGDAAFVKLDITEELLRREEWNEAASMARELVELFSAAGVTLASVNALDYLRRAVENRVVTPAVLEYVRRYVEADDPSQPFGPPAIVDN
jgi:tetratricopeptide (TPR) repeat protein